MPNPHEPGIERAGSATLEASPSLDIFGQPFGAPYEPLAVAQGASLVVDYYDEGRLDAAVSADSMSKLEIQMYAGDVLAEEPDVVQVPDVEPESHISEIGKWIVSSDHGRTERSRDSRDTHEDRLFDRRVAQARQQLLKKQGKLRPRPAADGYLPGETPHREVVWNRTVAETVLFEEHERDVVLTGLARETLIESVTSRKRFAEREAERALEAAAKIKAASDAVFDAYPVISAEEAEVLSWAERAEFAATADPAPIVKPTKLSKPGSAYRGLRKGVRQHLLQIGGRPPRHLAATAA